MAGDGKKLQPIIVKRVRKGGHAANHSAWKIAYADFVTALMAFFLLMWLMGSTAKGELQGIASYFSNPVTVAFMGGNGTGNSASVLPGGGRDLSHAFGQIDGGDAQRAAKIMGAQMARTEQIRLEQIRQEKERKEQARKDQERIEALDAKIRDVIDADPKLADYKGQIQLIKTPDGLQILIVDAQNRPMFDTGSALVKPYMRDILREIGGALVGVENRITLAGHTDATPYGTGQRGYSNWELSADRANASRRELVAGGLPDDKLVRVEGLASSRQLYPERPFDPANRRISIVVMTLEAEERTLPSQGARPPQTDALALADDLAAPLQISGDMTKKVASKSEDPRP